MTDHFALLQEARRPWVDPEELKQKFLTLSSTVHPDRVHQAPVAERQAADRRYAELNAAYNFLREPKDCLRHLLELEIGARAAEVQSVPTGLTDTAFAIGQLCRTADALVRDHERATSPLLQVSLFERAQAEIERLTAARDGIRERRRGLLAELQALTSAWEMPETAANRPWVRLEEIQRLLGYFDRWLQQLDERIFRLSF